MRIEPPIQLTNNFRNPLYTEYGVSSSIECDNRTISSTLEYCFKISTKPTLNWNYSTSFVGIKYSFKRRLALFYSGTCLWNSYSHVFIYWDAVRQPLQDPYDGSFEVRECKKYTVLVVGKTLTISIDGLKPAFIENFNNLQHHLKHLEIQNHLSN